MTTAVTTLLETPAGFRSREVARFVWQMDEKRRGLVADVADATIAELEWQVAPGMNTIGMLLAHIAYAETHLVQVGILGEKTGHAEDVIGISEADEGFPLAPGAPPSPALAGKDLAFFEAALAKARAHTHQAARALTDVDLDTEITRTRPDDSQRVFNKGWVLYHMLEHEAGHHAQINLLRHLHGVTKGR